MDLFPALFLGHLFFFSSSSSFQQLIFILEDFSDRRGVLVELLASSLLGQCEPFKSWLVFPVDGICNLIINQRYMRLVQGVEVLAVVDITKLCLLARCSTELR